MPEGLEYKCFIFADGTTAYSIGFDWQTGTKVLLSDLDNAYEWASTWGMLFNAQKMTIGTALSEGKGDLQSVTMNGEVVPPCTEHKHLGVIMQNRLSWKHIEYVHSACARQVGILLRMRGRLTKTSVVKIKNDSFFTNIFSS